MRYNVPGRRMGAGVGQRLPNHEERGRLGQQQGNQTTGGYQHGNRSSHGNRSHHSQRSQFVNNSPGSGSHDLYSTSTVCVDHSKHRSPSMIMQCMFSLLC